MQSDARRSLTRREFVQTTATAATAALVLPGGLRAGQRRSANDVIRVGVIGCGGRGTGAVRDHCRANDNVEIVAMADLFPDRLQQSLQSLRQLADRDEDFGSKFRVTDSATFTGFDAYLRVLEQDIDLVILATPPGFRPMHLAAAVDAGKHIFTEKPVAVDSAGVRSVLATYEKALQKGLAIVAGTQRRHDLGYRAVIERVHNGAIGDIVGGQVYWNQGGLWHRDHEPGWSDAEWQIRNWLYFTWLSGDHIVEQHVHNIDVANWVMGTHPIRATAVGGRQSRIDPVYGHIYDHFAVDFEYPNGVRILSMCRQIDGSANFVGERFFGTKGRTDAESTILHPDGTEMFRYEGDDPNPYVQEHVHLVQSIRSGNPLNELKQVAESTLTAIMGREAAYTGGEVTWDEVLNANMDIMPPRIEFGSLEVPPVAMPGRTKLERGWLDGWA